MAIIIEESWKILLSQLRKGDKNTNYKSTVILDEEKIKSILEVIEAVIDNPAIVVEIEKLS